MRRCRAACSADLATSPYLPAPGTYGSDLGEECRKEAGGVISCCSRLRSTPPRHPCPDSLLRPGLISSSRLTWSSFWQSFTQKRRNAESWRIGRLYPGLLQSIIVSGQGLALCILQLPNKWSLRFQAGRVHKVIPEQQGLFQTQRLLVSQRNKDNSLKQQILLLLDSIFVHPPDFFL